ncbi:MAG: endonuclease/exonuclease/phosphatase family protein [Candidatus Cryptobacteroides sp.]|jgi:endonuclease/exonuclease/phosphatase family metal-dependent hydrolase
MNIKSAIWFLILATVVSCGKENPAGKAESVEQGRLVRLQAALGEETKASVTETGAVSWEENDEISVWTSAGVKRTFSMVSISEGQAYFQAYLDVGESPKTLAVYPVRSFASLSGNTARIVYPYTYTYREGQMDAPMAAIMDGETISFRHLGGVVRIQCDNVPAAASKFNLVANGQQIVGNFNISVGSGMSAVTIDNSSYTKAIVNFTAGTGAKTFNIPIPTGAYRSIYAYFSDSSDNKICEWQVLSEVNVARGDMFVRPMPADMLRIVSFNIRFAHDEESYSPGDGRLWSERKLIVPGALANRYFEVMGSQENTTQQIADILSDLSGYSAIGTSNHGYPLSSLGYASAYETSAIYYKSSLTLLESGSFAISGTHTRRCNWAKLRYASRDFYIFNAHLQVGETPVYAAERKTQAAEILTEIKKVSCSYPVIWTGDFNCWDASADDVIKYIIDDGTMHDTRSNALNPHGSSGSLHYFQADNPATRRIDYVFVNNRFNVQSFWIDNSQQKNAPAWESDHNPVIVDLSII